MENPICSSDAFKQSRDTTWYQVWSPINDNKIFLRLNIWRFWQILNSTILMDIDILISLMFICNGRGKISDGLIYICDESWASYCPTQLNRFLCYVLLDLPWTTTQHNKINENPSTDKLSRVINKWNKCSMTKLKERSKEICSGFIQYQENWFHVNVPL